MKADELRDLVEKYKNENGNINLENNQNNFDSKREEAMNSYLADVGPISKFINEGFAKIEQEKNRGMEK